MKKKKSLIIACTIMVFALLAATCALVLTVKNRSDQSTSTDEPVVEPEPIVEEEEDVPLADAEEYIEKYDRFILVDISEQQLNVYNDGECKLIADIVTGTKGEYDTRQGEFSVFNKVKDTHITGPDWDYDIACWIGFWGHEDGFHDAWWRPDEEFDTHTQYLEEGSHGCVNMREADILAMYDLIEVDDPVIIRE